MYRRPKFLEVLLEIRRNMSREADYDVDLFGEMVRSDGFPADDRGFALSEPAPERAKKGKKAGESRKS
ncbi:MAG: hypothetical protein JSS81_16475 [Acidobacteria bacterium]|nr:hypothetical protein [Acidobacteriota bacterium]